MDETVGAIPWYKSKIFVGALTSLVTKGLVVSGLLPDALGDSAGDLANAVVTGLSIGADALVLHARKNQKQAATIVTSASKAAAHNGMVEAVPQSEVEADRIANALQADDVAGEPYPAQASAQLLDELPVPEVEEERLIAFGQLVSAEFKHAVLWIEDKLGLNADYLMCCMHFETGGSFSPSVKNAAGSSGLGLIQFMRATHAMMVKRRPMLARLAPTHADLADLSAVQQLSFVFWYFEAFGTNLQKWSIEDVYMAILLPKAIGKPLSWKMPWEAGSLAYRQNRGLDLNKDSIITKAEAAAGVTKRQALGAQLKG